MLKKNKALTCGWKQEMNSGSSVFCCPTHKPIPLTYSLYTIYGSLPLLPITTAPSRALILNTKMYVMSMVYKLGHPQQASILI